MKNKRQITLVLLAEAAALLLVSVSAYYFCLSHSLRMTVLLAMIAAGFTAIQLPWCIRFLFWGKRRPQSQETDDWHPIMKSDTAKASTMYGYSFQLAYERLVLLYTEHQYEQKQYLQLKEKDDVEKLDAILKYTRKTFNGLDLEEAEVFQICESVRYFVTRRKIMLELETRIRKRSHITQISLKNFAWNIAFQYGIEGVLTAEFVLVTFREWFTRSSLHTIRKTLRNPSGKHRIKIDKHII